MPRYYRKGYRYPRAYGTRYRSTRKYPGLYRKSSRYTIIGSARRRFGRNKFLKMLQSVAEHKYFDFNNTYDGTLPGSNKYINGNGVMECLSQVPQGASDSMRVGDKITITSIQATMRWGPSNFAQCVYTYTFRMILFIWKDDTTPTTADIMQLLTPIGVNALTPIDYFYQHDKKIKRKILFDKSWSSSQSNAGGLMYCVTENSTRQVKIYIPGSMLGKYRTIHFQSATTTAVNHIYCLMINNVPAGQIPAIFLPADHYLLTRINFIDV